MPVYEIVERHHIQVAAPAELTFVAACEMNVQQSRIARLIFRARELALGASASPRMSRGIVDETRALGWGVLKEDPGREIVIGAVTKPWEADVVFRALPPDQFEAFDEPGFVKIVWTLRADPVSLSESMFRTETRAVATDRAARRRFRRYWSFVSPGIVLIRWLMLEPLKREAERRAHGVVRDGDPRCDHAPVEKGR